MIVLILFTAVSCKDKSCSHVWNDGEITTPATCKEEGVKTYTCTLCGEKKRETVAITSDHKFVTEAETPATCTEKGSRAVKCSVCGKTDTEEIPPLGHSLVYEVTTSSESSVVSITAPTCKSTGSYTVKCKVEECTYSDTKTLDKDAAVHTDGTYESSDYKEATEAEEGSITVSCDDCSVSKTTSATYIDTELIGKWKCEEIGVFDFKADGTVTGTVTGSSSSNSKWGVFKVEGEKPYKVVYVLESGGVMILCYFPESDGPGYLVIGDDVIFTRVSES